MINAQPARDKVIDTLNSVWFDFLLLSAEIWGRADSFCAGQKWPLTSLPEMWRLLLDTCGFLEHSQLVHVNWRNPRLLKWKTDFEDHLREQSLFIFPSVSGVGLLHWLSSCVSLLSCYLLPLTPAVHSSFITCRVCVNFLGCCLYVSCCIHPPALSARLM